MVATLEDGSCSKVSVFSLFMRILEVLLHASGLLFYSMHQPCSSAILLPSGRAPRRKKRRRSHRTLAALQVVGLAALSFAWRGYRFSWQFERGQKWDGYAPGLQPGALGRRVAEAMDAAGVDDCGNVFNTPKELWEQAAEAQWYTKAEAMDAAGVDDCGNVFNTPKELWEQAAEAQWYTKAEAMDAAGVDDCGNVFNTPKELWEQAAEAQWYTK
ncbi:hypothetical protein ABPG75_002658 [Micractinium tetrahymenae]